MHNAVGSVNFRIGMRLKLVVPLSTNGTFSLAAGGTLILADLIRSTSHDREIRRIQPPHLEGLYDSISVQPKGHYEEFRQNEAWPIPDQTCLLSNQ